MKYSIFENGGDLEGSVSINGLTMTGKLKLLREATEPNEAVNKQFVDNAVGNLDASKILSGTMPVDRFPGLSGDFVSVAGSGVISLKNTGVIPGNYTKVTVNNSGLVISGGNLTENDIPNLGWEKITEGKPTTLAGYGITDAVNRNNGTVNGNVTLAHDPIDDDDVVTKAYADNALANREALSVGDIVQNAGIDTPVGFLRCNGAEVNKSLYADLYAILGDKVISNSQIPGSGLPWRNQYEFNTEQSTSLGNWVSLPNIPVAASGDIGVVTKNKLYLLIRNTGCYCNLNEDGTLGPWTLIPHGSLGLENTNPVVIPLVVMTKNKVYLLGSKIGSSNSDKIYVSNIDEEGNLSLFTESGTLPTSNNLTGIFIVGRKVYIIDNLDKNIYSSNIDVDGNLGSWVFRKDFSNISGTLSACCVINKKIHIFVNVSASVKYNYYFTVLDDGSISDVSSPISIISSFASYTDSIFLTKNRIFALTESSSSIGNRTQLSAPINPDGTIGTFTSTTGLTTATTYRTLCIVKNRIYSFGGNSGTGSSALASYATFSGGRNDYSEFYTGSMGVIKNPDNFILPDYSSLEDPSSTYVIKY